MQSWLAKRILTHNMKRVSAGDYRPQLRLCARDVRFRFPGDSSWAGEIRGKAEYERWLARFVDAGLQIQPDEVVVKGPPWKATVCVRGTDHLRSPDGELVYFNRYVIWGHLRWGLMRDLEVYEDTQQTGPLDAYLAERDRQLAPAASGPA
jgi:ketosteroid isomerase-like protein